MSAYLAEFSAAFDPWDFRIQGDPTTDVVARDVDGGHSVLDLVHEVCESAGSLLWQDRDGVLVYGTASHRVGSEATVYIDNCDVVDGVEWVKSSTTLVNRVKITYGPLDVEPRPVYEAEDPVSVADEGPREVSITSVLSSETDAVLLANLILFRRVRPYWVLPGGITVTTRGMRTSEYEALLGLDVSSVVLINLPRNPGYPDDSVEWVIEGWVEQWEPGEDGGLNHTMQMALSDRQRFGLTGIRTVGELAAGFTVGTAAAMSVRNAMFKEIA